jgi:CDP-diacylglycerol--serine O-phosphatidyltransferase
MSKGERLIDLLKLKDYITITGTSLGLLALIFASTGGRAGISWGFFFIAFTVATDLLDGYIARKTNTVNEIGIQLDSLNDSLTFGIAPAVLTFLAFRTGELYDIFLIIGSIIFTLGGILRLARFNISKSEGYTGIPTPMSGLILLNFFYGNYFYAVFESGGGAAAITYPFPSLSIYIIPFLMIFIGWTNITTYIEFGKKGKKVYILFLVFAPLCPIFGIIGILNPTALVGLIVSIVFFVFVSLLLSYIIYGLFRTLIKKVGND